MSEAKANELKPGDRIAFLGDSITQAGVRPGGYVHLFREAVDLALGESQVEVIGAGITGNKVPDCQQRLDLDVLARQPTHVVIYVGVNDVWHSTRGQGTSKEAYRRGLLDLIQRCQARHAKVFLCTPGVIGEKTDGSNSLDDMLEEYAQISREVADQSNAELIDLRRHFLDHLRKINPNNQPHSVLTTDGLHLNGMGNRFVADCLLSSCGIELPASTNRVLRHVVMFKFKKQASEEQIRTVDQAFRALPDKIPEVIGFEAGTNNSPEGLSQGFNHVYLVSFRGENERAVYLPHPEHQKFVELSKPHVEAALVVDFWAEVATQDGS